MYQIVGNAGNPPGKGHGPAPNEKVGDGAQRSEEQTENPGKHGKGQRPVLPAQAPCQKRKQRPGVEVHDPPQAETVQAPFQKDEGEDSIDRFPAKGQGVQNDKQRYNLYIGQKSQGYFACLQGGGHNPDQGDVFDRQCIIVRFHILSCKRLRL